MLSDTVGRSKIGMAMGFCSLALNGALLLAPVLGGLALQQSGFMAVFAVTFAFIGADLAFRLLVVEKSVAERYYKHATPRYWIITYGHHGTPSISASPDTAIDDIEPLLLSSETSPSPYHESPCIKRPMLSLLRLRRLRVLLLANFVEITYITAFDAVLPGFTHKTFGWGSLGAGLIFIPVVLPALIAPWIGRLSDKYGARLFIFGGFLAATPNILRLRLVENHHLSSIILLCALLSCLGLSTALISAPVMAEITYLVEKEEQRRPGIFGEKGAYAQAYALYLITTSGGLLVGPCWGGFINHALGWPTMGLTLGLLCAITSAPVFLWLY